MNRARTLVVAAFLSTVVLLLAGCGADRPTRATAEPTPLSVRVQPVERAKEGRLLEVRGTVHPRRQTFVSSRVSGPVVALMVRAGDTVAAGAPLLEIQPEASQGQLDQARGGLAQAEAARVLAARNLERYEALHAEKAASDLELDIARMQAEQARGAVEQTRGAVAAASSVAAEAIVRAPFAARVVETLVELGELATPGRPLVQVESARGSQLHLAVPAGDIALVAVGDRIEVVLDARPDLATLDGVVAEIVPSAEPQTHTFTVKLDLGGAEVASGLTGFARLPGGASERLVVPASAVHRRGGLELVVVRAADGRARTRAVTTGSRRPDGSVEVLSGLAEGELVALDAAAPPADGTPLEVLR